MSKFVIELTDNGDGVAIKAHAIHTTEQLQSGQTVTLATQLGDCLVAHLERRMTTVGLSSAVQSNNLH